MPTKKQLSQRWETEMRSPSLRAKDDPMYQEPKQSKLSQKESEWISITDRLPEDQLDKDYADDILVWNGDTGFAVYRHGKFLKRDWLGKWNNVTHWMPTPEPPN